MVRALSSHQCGPCSNPSVGAICELSLLLVLYFAPRGFFAPCTPVQSSFPQTQHFQIPIRQGMVDEERHRGCAAYHVIYLFIYLFIVVFFLQSTCEMDSSICGDNEVCIPNYQDNSLRCVCKVGYTGTPCSKLHTKYGYDINCP